MSSISETDRLVHDKIRMSWLNLNAREVQIQPLNGSRISLSYRGLTFNGSDLIDCVDQALEKLDGTDQGRFAAKLDTPSHPRQIGVPTEGAERSSP